MDIVSHVALGMTCSHLAFHQKLGRKSFVIGAVAGVFADIDSLWYWPTSPVFNLLVHRSVTHSLILLPLFSLLVAWLLFRFYRKRQEIIPLSFLWGASALSYGAHLLIDWLNSYGTYLFWPISFERYYADLVPIIDPLFTIPLIICVIYSYLRQNWKIHFLSLSWISFYLLIMFLQHESVMREQAKLVLARGQETVKGRALPTIGNIFTWRSLYRTPTHAVVDKVICFPLILPRIEVGQQVPLATVEGITTTYLNTELIQNNFSYFEKYSDGFVAFMPSTQLQKHVIGDLRYSRDLKSFESRVQVEFDPSQAARPVRLLRYH